MVGLILSGFTIAGFTLGALTVLTFPKEVIESIEMVEHGFKQFKKDMHDFIKWIFGGLNTTRKIIVYPVLAMKLGANQAGKELFDDSNDEAKVG